METKVTPPDGGWGWIIVLAFAVNTVISIPIMQSFGLLFTDTFTKIGITATDSSIIINTNQAFGMMMGLVNGVLLNHFGYRKVAVAAAVCMFSGVILTAFASSFAHFLVSFGLLTSLGMGLGMSSYSLALNTYFLKNRGKATGIAFTITGLGPIGMPQLISFFMHYYGVRGAVLMLAGIVAHTFVASCLLQPVKWHMKGRIPDGAEKEGKSDKEASHTFLGKEYSDRENKFIKSKSTMSINTGPDLPDTYMPISENIGISMCSLPDGQQKYVLEPTKTKWWSSLSSIPSVNLASSVKLFDEKEKRYTAIIAEIPEDEEKVTEEEGNDLKNDFKQDAVYNPNLSKAKKKKPWIKRAFIAIVESCDLKLLLDPIYVNIMIGMSLAVFAELNFAMLIPFMLADFGFETSKIATFMSVLAVADLVFRFFSPFIADHFKKTPRVMYLISLALLIAARFAFIIVPGFKGLLIVAVFLGISKGVRTVYMSLVIPSHVPLERLASASGIQMVTNGCLFLVGGPLIGLIRDITGTYRRCVILMNVFTFLTIIMWSIEMVYIKIKSAKRDQTINETVNYHNNK